MHEYFEHFINHKKAGIFHDLQQKKLILKVLEPKNKEVVLAKHNLNFQIQTYLALQCAQSLQKAKKKGRKAKTSRLFIDIHVILIEKPCHRFGKLPFFKW